MLTSFNQIAHGTAGGASNDAWLDHVEMAERRVPAVPRIQPADLAFAPTPVAQKASDGPDAYDASLFGGAAAVGASVKG